MPLQDGKILCDKRHEIIRGDAECKYGDTAKEMRPLLDARAQQIRDFAGANEQGIAVNAEPWSLEDIHDEVLGKK